MASANGYSASASMCICGRPSVAGYDACCRACKESNGTRHGSRCEGLYSKTPKQCSENDDTVQRACKLGCLAGDGYASSSRACKDADVARHGMQAERACGRGHVSSNPNNAHPGCGIVTTSSHDHSWGSLPPELLLWLPDYLGHPKDFCRSESVCQEWASLGRDGGTWQRLCNEWYPAMVAKVACNLEQHACIVACGRSANDGYHWCCRACKETDGERHGSWCEGDKTADTDWRELFQARYITQQAWHSKKQEKKSLRKERAEREQQQAIMQDKQRGQNFRGQENGQRSVRSKTCKRCGLGYLPKDNVDLACTYHPGRFELRRPAGDGSQPVVEQFTGTRVQQAVWSLRRKNKKNEPASRSSHVQLLSECGMDSTKVWQYFHEGLVWNWTCCAADKAAAVGCACGNHM